MNETKTGIIRVNGNAFVFRRHEGLVLGWDVNSEPSRGRTDKWQSMPKGDVELFDIDNPPQTVSYQPILAPFV